MEAELVAGLLELARVEPMDGPDARSDAYGVDEDRFAAVVQPAQGIEAGHAAVHERDARRERVLSLQALEDMVAEPVVSVPRVAQAENARRSHHSVKLRAAPRPCAR